MFIDTLEPRQFLSATFELRRAPSIPSSLLTGGYAGDYVNTTTAESGDLFAGIVGSVANPRVFAALLSFDGVEVYAQGTIKGRSIRFNVRPQYAEAYEGYVKITAKASLSPDGETLHGTYKLVVRGGWGGGKEQGIVLDDTRRNGRGLAAGATNER